MGTARLWYPLEEAFYPVAGKINLHRLVGHAQRRSILSRHNRQSAKTLRTRMHDVHGAASSLLGNARMEPVLLYALAYSAGRHSLCRLQYRGDLITSLP